MIRGGVAFVCRGIGLTSNRRSRSPFRPPGRRNEISFRIVGGQGQCERGRKELGALPPSVRLSQLFALPPCFRWQAIQYRGVPSEPIITTGEVLRIFSERAFEVSLPNGKKVIGHPAKALAEKVGRLVPGARVRLEMTPFDFEKARIAAILPTS